MQKKRSIFAEATDAVESSGTDSDDEEAKGGYMSRIKKRVKKKGGDGGGGGNLLTKWKVIMSHLSNAEQSLENVAQVLEKLKNLFLWKNFTASFFLSILLSIISIAAYFLSQYLRYIICVGGTFKILKEGRMRYYGLRKDEHWLNSSRSSSSDLDATTEATLKKGNPVLNMISRVPSDLDIRQVGRFRPRVGEWEKQKMRDTFKAKQK